MKFILVFIFLFITVTTSEKCVVTQEDCENMTSEYEKYRECMERRTKRSLDCQMSEYNCDKCDCDTCSYNSCSSCSTNNCCESCCQRNECRSETCCQQTCRAECKSHSCKTSCKKRCQDRYTEEQRTSDSSTKIHHQTKNQHNITTVIHLNNVINNTNLINLPITLNNTIFNNITNRGGASIGGGGYGYLERQTSENCCQTIGPRQCIPQSTFPFMRCFHLRKKACGNVCLAPVVHYQTHEVCDNDVTLEQPCRQQVVYIPQPQPRCAYQNSWPYVSCGNQQLQSCEGCYNHYIKREDVTKCSNFCYDDGYGTGPYYRQGPFYRPGFAHAASCMQTGLCGFEGYGYEGFNGYDGFPENGLPYMYPPQTYPFIVEDCKNCTYEDTWDGPNPIEPIHMPSYKNLESPVKWTNFSDKMMKIDAKVSPLRNERYAEIKIKSAKRTTLWTTLLPKTTTESVLPA